MSKDPKANDPKASANRSPVPTEEEDQKLEAFLAYFDVSSPKEIRWSHATNSVALLEAALAQGVQMIEADILMGTSTSSSSAAAAAPDFDKELGAIWEKYEVERLAEEGPGPKNRANAKAFEVEQRRSKWKEAQAEAAEKKDDENSDSDSNSALIPIMAHPPQTTSDLTFDAFLDKIAAHNKSKYKTSERVGLKLDFKSKEAVEPSLQRLKKLRTRSLSSGLKDCPVWVNADLWPGPGNGTPDFVPSQFFDECKALAPNATLSVGWKVKSSPAVVIGRGGYTTAHVDAALADLRAAYPDEKKRPLITFPVQAVLARLAKRRDMARLVAFSPGATLTCWGEATCAEHRFFDCDALRGKAFVDVAPAGCKVRVAVGLGLLLGQCCGTNAFCGLCA